ncbi:hypothetical protein F5Y13DRAFT_149119 [Hypoxylon sp. FL1857]|nr:hypothetical protein F5Y13DRAFT_149119 [Hypoxylon sp. FL1857]
MATRVLERLRALLPKLWRQKPLLPFSQLRKQYQAGRWPNSSIPHGVAWRTTFEPINIMLNEPDTEKKTQFTQKWLRNMERHLNIMIITSSVTSSIVASAFSWSVFTDDSDGSTCVKIVKACWYGALILSVSSIAAASQQITTIHRLDMYPDAPAIIHELLGEAVQSTSGCGQATGTATATPTLKLRLSQAFLWQIPVMLLNGSLYFFTAGLCILAYWDFTNSFSISVEAVQASRRPPCSLPYF